MLLIETSQDILEVKASIQGSQLAFEDSGKVLPIQAQVTLDTSGRMLLGTNIATALTILEGLPIDIIGANVLPIAAFVAEDVLAVGEQRIEEALAGQDK